MANIRFFLITLEIKPCNDRKMNMLKNLYWISIFLFACHSQKNQIEIPELTFDYHIALNEKYANPDESPLNEEDLKDFKSLKFYPFDETFKVKAAIKLTPEAIPFEMKTSTDRLPVYRQYAQLEFVLHGQQETLEAYQNQEYLNHPVFGKELFVPFLDETNGIETYGGGRYLDLAIPEEGTDSIWLDFNRSYNPYCAYNYKYSCPKPPSANTIDLGVEAGIKSGFYKK